MPLRITLTLDDELLAALERGESVQVTASAKRARPRTGPKLDDATAAKREELLALWHHHQPEVAPARVWKVLGPLVASEPHLAVLSDVALDYNTGRHYPPEWFKKDLAMWREKAALDLFVQVSDRSAYRKRMGLT